MAPKEVRLNTVERIKNNIFFCFPADLVPSAQEGYSQAKGIFMKMKTYR